jgi:hypothetical protein
MLLLSIGTIIKLRNAVSHSYDWSLYCLNIVFLAFYMPHFERQTLIVNINEIVSSHNGLISQ